jgi:prepilin-type N-terminal cleavage/methylation domain-containing protein
MVAEQTESGFTIVEIIITLAVMSIFLILFFQTYLANIAQQNAIILRSAADDIAVTNLKKVPTRSSGLLGSVTCDTGTPSANDLTAVPPGTGTVINLTGTAYEEKRTGTGLPASTTQTLTVLYPQGCTPPGTVPIEIISTVTYGSESVKHATYIY